jgi:hypothetical protein
MGSSSGPSSPRRTAGAGTCTDSQSTRSIAVHGIARRLIACGEARLRERGVPRITALVDGDDRVAAGAWEAGGYGRDPRCSRFVKTL